MPTAHTVAVSLSRSFVYRLLRHLHCSPDQVTIRVDRNDVETLQGLLHAAALELEGQR